MVTLAQRIEQLRGEAGLSRPALSAALGLPKGAVEKFETGRQTPTKDQQEKIANYFGVSLFYLRGESSDRTRQEDWMSMAGAASPQPEPVRPEPVPPHRPKKEEPAQGGTLLEALLSGRQAQEQLRAAVLEVLKSPEGQALLAKAVRQELEKRK